MIDDYINNAVKRFLDKIKIKPLSQQIVYVGQRETLLLTFSMDNREKIIEEYFKFPANKLFVIQFI